MIKLLAATLLALALFVASWTLWPITRVEVDAPAGHTPIEVAKAAGVYQGGPWLYAPLWAQRRLARLPWVATVEVHRASGGTLRIRVRARRPRLRLLDALGLPSDPHPGLALDAQGKPLAAGGGVPVRGFGQRLEVLVKLAGRFPTAKEIRFTPAGFSIDLPRGRVWTPTPNALGQAKSVQGELHLYAWGVSVKR